MHPLGRMAEVADVAQAVMYLESASFVTGVILLVVVAFVVANFVSFAAIIFVHAPHESAEQLKTDPAILLPGQAIASAITFLVMYLLITRGHRRPFWEGIRWIWPARKLSRRTGS